MALAGRTRKYGEPLSVRIPVLFTANAGLPCRWFGGKHHQAWRRGGEGLPELEDGQGQPLPLPEDTVRAVAIAVARGTITAF